jgi:hypothetical protein
MRLVDPAQVLCRADAAIGSVQRIWSDLMDRASANPSAALAIGAGLAWRFAHRPPIATLLVGVGLAGLLRTNPSSSPSPIIAHAAELGGRRATGSAR